MSARRIGRGLVATLLIVSASGASACDEPNEPNAIQPSDFMRSGDELDPSRAESLEPLPLAATRDEDATDEDEHSPVER